MRLLEAKIESFNTMLLTWDEPIEFAGIHFPGYTIVNIQIPHENKQLRLVEINGEFSLNEPVIVLWQQQELIAMTGAVVRTEEFEKRYSYGGMLGVDYGDHRTTFRLWAPTAMSVHLNIYEDESPESAMIQSYAMFPRDRGVWELVVSGDSNQLIYDYQLKFPNGIVHYSYDPYAVGCTLDGRRSVVIPPKYFQGGKALSFPEEIPAPILSADIEMLSGGRNHFIQDRLRETYLGVVEPGIKNDCQQPVGFDWLQEQPIDFVQLSGMYDSGLSEGQMRAPLNAMIPSARYTVGQQPIDRILELKRMIDRLHGINKRVLMELNLSHVTNAAFHALHLTVPGYYFRYDDDGFIKDSRGFGNDLATERKMVRHYLLAVVSHWFQCYHIDGLYVNDLGNIDQETVRQLNDCIRLIYPDAWIYGDASGNRSLSIDKSVAPQQASALPNIGFMNHDLKTDLLGIFTASNQFEERLAVHLLGSGQLDASVACFVSPKQVVHYLVTKLDEQMEQWNESELQFMVTALILAQGWALIPIDLLLQTTTMDWNSVSTHETWIHYIQSLIRFRKINPVFHLQSYEEIHQKAQLLVYQHQLLAYSLTDMHQTHVVMMNAMDEEQELSIPTGEYEVLILPGEVAEFPHKIEIRDQVMLPKQSMMVLRRND